MNPGSFPPDSTAEDFRKRPHSEPINEVITSIFFKSGLMEAWGRGIPDIFNECKIAGLPKPEFESIPNFVCLTIRFKNPLTPYLTGDGRNEGVNEGVNEILSGLGQAVRATYALIKQYPGLNAPQLASKCGKGDSTIERHVAILRKNDLIEHRGADKTGGYFIKEIQNNND